MWSLPGGLAPSSSCAGEVTSGRRVAPALASETSPSWRRVRVAVARELPSLGGRSPGGGFLGGGDFLGGGFLSGGLPRGHGGADLCFLGGLALLLGLEDGLLVLLDAQFLGLGGRDALGELGLLLGFELLVCLLLRGALLDEAAALGDRLARLLLGLGPRRGPPRPLARRVHRHRDRRRQGEGLHARGAGREPARQVGTHHVQPRRGRRWPGRG
mmetsp:Transcript_3354/g.10387  ORF Transcript_3354/g.10387 Transcript_3354/m.10387 type:complete len:214 (+) Transcript_3354:2-643(+)